MKIEDIVFDENKENTKHTNKFTVFYKSGGGEAIRVVDKYWHLITSIFDKMSEYEYSNEIDQFHIELRVDGEYLKFGDTTGCNNLKYFKKKRLIGNSISFGEDIYCEEYLLSDFLKKNLLLAFEQILDRLEKEKVGIERQQLLSDLTCLIDKNPM